MGVQASTDTFRVHISLLAGAVSRVLMYRSGGDGLACDDEEREGVAVSVASVAVICKLCFRCQVCRKNLLPDCGGSEFEICAVVGRARTLQLCVGGSTGCRIAGLTSGRHDSKPGHQQCASASYIKRRCERFPLAAPHAPDRLTAARDGSLHEE
eukprot:scaffold712_cov404-Prasinococcus_capsulatus_cf.AAC.13